MDSMIHCSTGGWIGIALEAVSSVLPLLTLSWVFSCKHSGLPYILAFADFSCYFCFCGYKLQTKRSRAIKCLLAHYTPEGYYHWPGLT